MRRALPLIASLASLACGAEGAEVREFLDETGRPFERCHGPDAEGRTVCQALAPTTGAVVREWSLRDGQLDGRFRAFCSDGTVRIDGRYEAGERTGMWRTMQVDYPGAAAGDVWTTRCVCPESEGRYARGVEVGVWRRWSRFADPDVLAARAALCARWGTCSYAPGCVPHDEPRR